MTQSGRKTAFTKWMRKQRKRNGEHYSSDVVDNYVSALRSNSGIVADARALLKDNIFAISDSRLFALVRKLIRLTPSFEMKCNADHRKLKAAMSAYEKYLNENS